MIHESMSMDYWWNDTDGKTKVLGEKPVQVSLCPPQISHRTDLGSYLGLCSEKPACNRLSHGTIFLEVTLHTVVGRSHHLDGSAMKMETTRSTEMLVPVASRPADHNLVYSDVSCSWHDCDSWRLHCILKFVKRDLCLWHISEAILLLCFRSVFQCSHWSPPPAKVRTQRTVKCWTRWRQMSTIVDVQCDAEETECPRKSSAMNMQSNGGHLNSTSFVECTGHLLSAPKG
jgi:hypothetical protein